MNGRQLLTLAAEFAPTAVATLLLDCGADPTWPDVNASCGSALYQAARPGNRPLVELLLQHAADPNTHVLASGNAVFAAARHPELAPCWRRLAARWIRTTVVWLDEDDEGPTFQLASIHPHIRLDLVHETIRSLRALATASDLECTCSFS